MLELKKIAITGGLATGKSSVCRYFQELGAYTVNTDLLAHELLNPETAIGQKILHHFGDEVIKDHQIDRSFLAKKVFEDPKQLHWLEKLLHPMILDKVKELYSKACKSSIYRSFVVEVPLLFEANWQGFFDFVVLVTSPKATQKKRWQSLGRSAKDFEKRTKRQLPLKEKQEQSHFILNNNGSLEALQKEVQSIHQKIIQST